MPMAPWHSTQIIVLDAHEIIEESQLDEDDKENEQAKILEERKIGFGYPFKQYPYMQYEALFLFDD